MWVARAGAPGYLADSTLSSPFEPSPHSTSRSGSDPTDREEAESTAKQPAEQLRFLFEIGGELTGSLAPAEILVRFARLAVPRLADWCIGDLVDEHGAVQRVAVAHADAAQSALAQRLRQHPRRVGRSIGSSFLLYAGQNHVGTEVVDSDDWTTPDSDYRALLTELGARSFVIAPLLTRRHLLGVLVFCMADSGRQFQEGDRPFFEELAQRIALVVDNSQLTTAEQRARAEAKSYAKRLAFLHEAEQVVAGSHDRDTTLQRLARLMVPALGDWCFIDLLDDETGTLRRAVEIPTSSDQAGSASRDASGSLDSYLDHRQSRALLANQLLPISDDVGARLFTGPQALKLLPLVRSLHADSAIVAPMVARQRLLGVITLVAAESDRYTEDLDVSTATTLARLSALAIDNDRLDRLAHRAISRRDEFLSVAAHELKTPITSLRGFSQLELRHVEKTGQFDPVRTRRAFQVIDSQAAKLARLVSQLLDVSRLQNGVLVLDTISTDLTALVRSVIATIQVPPQSRPITLTAPDVAMARVDPVRLEQVIFNLLDNAIKFSPTNGAIEVTISGDIVGVFRIAFRDHGRGIPIELREQIFQSFYRPERKDHQAGIGLGLSISRQIVELHGGQLTVELPPDGGACFIVTLPSGESEDGRNGPALPRC